jgi:hypothetical protein
MPDSSRAWRDLQFVRQRLAWAEADGIWPNGLRYLWTDAFGLVLLVSLHRQTGEDSYLERAEWLVQEVERVLGRQRGIRIGEAPDRDGQYYHYLAMWLYALTCLGELRPAHRERAVELVREIHEPFVMPGVGVNWKMREDLSGPYPGYGLGALDHFHGYVVYRLLDPDALRGEIAQMAELVEATHRRLAIEQDLGLGIMLWMGHFFPEEEWAVVQRQSSLRMLQHMWVDPPGYFCRQPGAPGVRFAFTNYGVSLGLQAVGAWPEEVARMHEYMDSYRSGDHYDREGITHVMACAAHFPGAFLAGWRPAAG